MNSITQFEIDAVESSNATLPSVSRALNRARLYHFFELALAHPGEDGHEYFREDVTAKEFLDIYSTLLDGDEDLRAKGTTAANCFFSSLRNQSYEEVEAAYISLFSANYPHLPCPPYGSIFTATDSDKRLQEMLAIKSFYHEHGVDIAESFRDLPDHLCVELEFSQLLCFREDEASTNDDTGVLGGVRRAHMEFLDKFLLPLGRNLAALAAASMPDNPYCSLLESMRSFLEHHRQELGAFDKSAPSDQEIRS